MRVAFSWINWGGPLGMSQGVSILASELADAGHEVVVIHHHEDLFEPAGESHDPHQACAAAIAAVHPDVALFSFGSNQAAVTRRVIGRFKQLCPHVPTMGGGVHCTLTPEEPLGWGSMDYVFVGEADGRMDGIVTKLGLGVELDGEPNIAFRRRGFVKRAAVQKLPDVTRQAPPFFKGIDYRDLCIRMRGNVDLVAGRGCPYRCTYCHNAGLIELYRGDLGVPVGQIGFTRTRDPHELLAECKSYREICGEHLKMFSWGDDMAVMSKPFLRTWADIYPREFADVPFALNATLNFLDDEVVSLLAAANCNLVKFGLESGSARLRKFMRRPDYKEEVVVQALARLRRHGINSRAYVIVGIPTETEEEMLSTFRLAAELRIDTVRPSILFPYPGTPIHAYCEEHDLVDREVLDSVHNYYSRSVLRGFDARMQMLLGRIIDVFPVLMNVAIGGAVGAAYAPLGDAVLHTPEDRWLDGEREHVLAAQERLNRRFAAEHAEFYAVPFPDRPDASFLMRRRARPLVNVDDATNRDVVAV